MIYYVACGGDDSNPGAIDEPWATFEKGAGRHSILEPGDTLYLREGTYYGRSSTFVMPNDGTADAPITIASYPGERAVLTHRSGDAVWWLKNNYIVIDGVDWDGTVGGWHYGLCLESGYHHTIVRDCIFHDFGSNYIKWHGIALQSPDTHSTVEYCEFYESPDRPQESSGAFIDSVSHNYLEIHHCYFHDARNAGTEGLLLKGGTKHCSVHHNFFERIGVEGTDASWDTVAIEIGGSSSSHEWIGDWECEDTKVYNNVIINGSAAGIVFWSARNCSAYNNTIINQQGNYGIGLHGGSVPQARDCENITLKNNLILYGGDYGNLRIYPEQETGFVSDNNLFWRVDGQPLQFKWNGSYVDFDTYRALSGQDGNSIVADPLLTRDYELAADSPAIDAGIDEAGVPDDDFDGAGRPQGAALDIGAYEFRSEGGDEMAEHFYEPASRVVTVDENSGDATDINFIQRIRMYGIAGRVTNSLGDGIGGVIVSAGGRSDSTDETGHYLIDDLPAGTYQVTPQVE